jgi:hypothetical protein
MSVPVIKAEASEQRKTAGIDRGYEPSFQLCAAHPLVVSPFSFQDYEPAFPTPALRKKREGTGHPLCW